MSIIHRINSYFQICIIILIERLPALLNIEMEVTAYERYFKELCERFCLRLCRQYHHSAYNQCGSTPE
nr:MAG TPA: hypothetical protein [Caudoviricetes sp.]